MNMRKKTCVLIISAALGGLVPSLANAVANIGTWSFLKGTPAEEFTDEDWTIFEGRVMSTLDNEADGASKTWENPKTQHSGTITVVKTLKVGDQDCRQLQIENQTPDRKRTTNPLFCKQPDGKWKLSSLKPKKN